MTTLKQDLTRLIIMLRGMAQKFDSDSALAQTDYKKAMDHGLAIGYRSAANMIEATLHDHSDSPDSDES